MGKQKEKDVENELVIKNEIRELEQFYTNGVVDDLFDKIEVQKEQLVADMIEYKNNHTEPCKWDRDGYALAYEVKINPVVINNHYFKPIIPITSVEPEYTAEKLGMVYDYYCDILMEVNDKIGNFPSSLTSFCKMAGITTKTLRNYRNSSDINMRIIAEKIYDQIGDENITMSQMGIVRERSTIFKMKSQNELIEKQQPSVHINITEKPDLDRIQERLNKYKNFANKKDK